MSVDVIVSSETQKKKLWKRFRIAFGVALVLAAVASAIYSGYLGFTKNPSFLLGWIGSATAFAIGNTVAGIAGSEDD